MTILIKYQCGIFSTIIINNQYIKHKSMIKSLENLDFYDTLESL